MQPLDFTDQHIVDLRIIRAAEIIAFHNEVNGQSYLEILEISKPVTPLDGIQVARKEQTFIVPYDENENFNVPLINPLTGEALGPTVSVPEIMTLLYSIYAFARKRHLALVAAQNAAAIEEIIEDGAQPETTS